MPVHVEPVLVVERPPTTTWEEERRQSIAAQEYPITATAHKEPVAKQSAHDDDDIISSDEFEPVSTAISVPEPVFAPEESRIADEPRTLSFVTVRNETPLEASSTDTKLTSHHSTSDLANQKLSQSSLEVASRIESPAGPHETVEAPVQPVPIEACKVTFFVVL